MAWILSKCKGIKQRVEILKKKKRKKKHAFEKRIILLFNPLKTAMYLFLETLAAVIKQVLKRPRTYTYVQNFRRDVPICV